MLFKHHLVFLSFPPLRWMMCAKAAASWATALLTVLDIPSFAPRLDTRQQSGDHLFLLSTWRAASSPCFSPPQLALALGSSRKTIFK